MDQPPWLPERSQKMGGWMMIISVAHDYSWGRTTWHEPHRNIGTMVVIPLMRKGKAT